jgi:hypothetical protein
VDAARRRSQFVGRGLRVKHPLVKVDGDRVLVADKAENGLLKAARVYDEAW